MLVVTRKRNERIVIGEKIIVTLVSVEGRKVRIGIDAPRDLKILREELVNPSLRTIQEVTALAEGN